ncbi:MAG: hypothetical protein KDC66_16335 [Phaeodactylibacter sp.]|nr:hypothetical protein [Phaeodactylibacter sp.]MCB9273510.1 hypothetical protein [Lewinellaceae bacterium]
MINTIAFEAFQTVPVVALSDMTPYMQLSESEGQSFPIPGDEFTFMRFDLSRALIRNPEQTFFILLTENHLAAEGYSAGDIAIVERQATPRNNEAIIAFLEGAFTIRKLKVRDDRPFLVSGEEVLEIEPDMAFSIWGAVRDILRR